MQVDRARSLLGDKRVPLTSVSPGNRRTAQLAGFPVAFLEASFSTRWLVVGAVRSRQERSAEDSSFNRRSKSEVGKSRPLDGSGVVVFVDGPDRRCQSQALGRCRQSQAKEGAMEGGGREQ